MNNETSKLLKSAVASAFVIASSTAFSGAITDLSSGNTITGDDTINAAGTITDADAATDTMLFNIATGGDNGDDNLSVTITGAGTVTLGAITNGTSDGSGDTADLVVGNGSADTVVIISGDVTGLDQNGTPVTGANLDIFLDADDQDTTSGDSTLKIYGDVDSATGLIMRADSDSTATLQIGDGTNAATFAGAITINDDATHGDGASVITISAGSTLSGAVDVAANAGGSVTINLGSGSTLSGAISDTAAATTGVTINVDASSTISSAIDLGHTDGASTPVALMAIDDGATLTASGTGGYTLDTITLSGSGTLKVTGAKTITGAVTGAASNTATLDIDATTTITGRVGATAIATGNIAADKVLTLSGNAAHAIDNLTLTAGSSGTTELEITGGASASFTGNIIGGADTLLDVNGALTITGETGKTTAITAATVDGGNLTVAGDYNATTTTVNSSYDFITDAAAAQTITGNITTGDLYNENTDGTVTFASNVGSSTALVNIDLNDDTTTVFQGTVGTATMTLASAAASSNTAAIVTFEKPVTLSGALTTQTGAKINLGEYFVDATTKRIVFSAGADSDLTSGSVTVQTSNQFTSGHIVLLDNDGNTVAADPDDHYVVTDTALVDYTVAKGDGTTGATDQVVITASKRTAAGTATYLGMNEAQTNALGSVTAALASGDTSGSDAVDTALWAGGTTAVNAVEQLNPDVVSTTGAALNAVNSMNTVISTRVGNTRVAALTRGQSGISTGDKAGREGWFKVFGSTASQDTVDNVDGYDSDSYGLVYGFDVSNSADSTIGYSVGISTSETDGKSAALSKTDTDTVMFGAYGDDGNMDWNIGYSFSSNESKRSITLGGLARTAKGVFDSNVLTARVGRSFDEIKRGNSIITPKADVKYQRVSTDAYDEGGASNLNLNVKASNNNYLTLRGGVEMTTESTDNTTPYLSLMLGYDAINDRAKTESTFAGGGAQFTTQAADGKKLGLDISAGSTTQYDNSSVSFGIDASLKDGYSSAAVNLDYRYNF